MSLELIAVVSRAPCRFGRPPRIRVRCPKCRAVYVTSRWPYPSHIGRTPHCSECETRRRLENGSLSRAGKIGGSMSRRGLVLGAFGSPDRYAPQCTCGAKLASETCAVHGRKR